MKKNLRYVFVAALAIGSFISAKAQNEVYWREGFQSDQGCDLTSIAPTATGGSYFTGQAGTWYAFNAYRTTGTGCPAGNDHVRYKNISGVTDSGYLVTPIVYFGVKELHLLRARASRSFTVWATSDTLATTTNWTVVATAASSAATVTCVDTTFLINSGSTKRLKIVGRPGTDSDLDSFFVTSVAHIAPVKFGNINLSQTNGFVKVSWDVLTEINTEKYYIERSANGVDFSAIGSLTAINASKYSFVDNTPLANVTGYYRIKTVDKDGSIGYSTIVKIGGKQVKADIAVVPNPVIGGLLNLQMNNLARGTYTASLFDAAGKQVFSKVIVAETGNTLQVIQLTNVKAGMYQLQVSNGDVKINKAVFVQ